MPDMTEEKRQARLQQLQELYEERLLNEAPYRVNLEALGVDLPIVLKEGDVVDRQVCRMDQNQEGENVCYYCH